MIALVQRVKKTSLSVSGELISEIPFGLCVYLGVKQGDDEEKAKKVALKLSQLRVFPDDCGKMNLSVKDVGGEILLVSQFTLLGDLSRGTRPSYSSAERPERAKKLYELCANELKSLGVSVKTGIFGADMQIQQLNDGPVSVIYEI